MNAKFTYTHDEYNVHKHGQTYSTKIYTNMHTKITYIHMYIYTHAHAHIHTMHIQIYIYTY